MSRPTCARSFVVDSYYIAAILRRSLLQRNISVLHHARTFAAWDDFVGRAPRPAADPLVGLLEHTKSRTRGAGADGGVRPTFGCGCAAWWDRRYVYSSRRLCPVRSTVHPAMEIFQPIFHAVLILAPSHPGALSPRVFAPRVLPPRFSPFHQTPRALALSRTAGHGACDKLGVPHLKLRRMERLFA